jgi:hypothetical protein
MEFWLSGSLSHELFLFARRNSSYHEPFSRTLSFFMMESWLSRSLFTNFSFTSWNLGYHEAFSRIFLSHGGISAITKPFHEFFFHMVESRLSRSIFTNFSFTWWNLGYHKAFSWIFLSHGGISAITKPFHEFFFHMVESQLSRSFFTNFSFTWWNPQNAQFGGRNLFIYTTKSIYIRSASLKTLPLDLEPPLQGKE